MIGGETIDDADLTTYKLKDLPEKLEAGTPDIAGVFGMGATVDYLQKVGMESIEKQERESRKPWFPAF